MSTSVSESLAAPTPPPGSLLDDPLAPGHIVELDLEPTPPFTHRSTSQSCDEPDDIGVTVFAIPLRNELAGVRVRYALSNIGAARATVDQALQVLSTVIGFHFETYRLGNALGTLTDALQLLDLRIGLAEAGNQLFDLKKDPPQADIANWIDRGVPLPL